MWRLILHEIIASVYDLPIVRHHERIEQVAPRALFAAPSAVPLWGAVGVCPIINFWQFPAVANRNIIAKPTSKLAGIMADF